MPYISTESNRYICEHSCGLYHYGDQTVVRDCCVADAIKAKENLLKVALTSSHPAYAWFRDAWNSLTDAEMAIVGDVVANHGVANGFHAA